MIFRPAKVISDRGGSMKLGEKVSDSGCFIKGPEEKYIRFENF